MWGMLLLAAMTAAWVVVVTLDQEVLSRFAEARVDYDVARLLNEHDCGISGSTSCKGSFKPDENFAKPSKGEIDNNNQTLYVTYTTKDYPDNVYSLVVADLKKRLENSYICLATSDANGSPTVISDDKIQCPPSDLNAIKKVVLPKKKSIILYQKKPKS